MELHLRLEAIWQCIIKDIGVSWHFKDVVGDTFAVIAGFVAIGIPLALQITHAISEKYDNPLIIKRATSGFFVTPTRLVVLTILYLTLALLFKVLVNNVKVGDEPFMLNLLEKTVWILFIVILLGTAIFYIRLYRKTLQPAHLFLPELLQTKKSQWKGIFERIILIQKKYPLARFSNEFFAKYSSRKSRISDRKIDTVAAGLEVLSFKLETKIEDENFRVILSDFHRYICDNYFGDYNHRYQEVLSGKDFLVLEMYWRFLLKTIRLVRDSGDNKLSFKVQRYLASIISLIIHSPQYDCITSEDYSSNSGFNWRQDVFELARWQSNQASKGIDLVLECEWISYINDFGQKIDLRYSSSGASVALDTAKSIFQYACENHPRAITKIYRNLVGSLPFTHEIRLPTHFGIERNWAYEYFNQIAEGIYYLSNHNDFMKDLIKLGSSEVYRKHGEFGVSKPFSNRELDEILSKINYTHLYEKSYMNSIKRIGLELMGSMALFGRWKEFESCLNWRQPSSAGAHYLGDNFFPESINELFNLLKENEGCFLDHVFFHEREGLKDYVIKSGSFVIKWLNKNSVNGLQLYNLNPFEYSDGFCKTLTLIVDDIATEEGPEVDKLVSGLRKFISKIESSLSVKGDRFSSGVEYLKKSLGENYIYQKDGFLSLFNIKPCLNVLQSEFLFSKIKFEGGLSNYDGVDIYNQFFSLIFYEVKLKAQEIDFSLVRDEGKVVVFSNIKNLNSLGFYMLQKSPVLHHSKNLEWKGIATDEPDVFLVFPDKFELHATYFESGFRRYPFLMVFSHNNNNLLKVDSYAYLNFIFEDDAVFKLNYS